MNCVTGQESYVAGGIPDLSELPVGSVSGLPVPFRGCIRQVSLNWHRNALDRDHILAARNIADCDGTRCRRDICEHGGSCWLDKQHMAHCSCLQVTHDIIHQQQQQGISHSRLVLSYIGVGLSIFSLVDLCFVLPGVLHSYSNLECICHSLLNKCCVHLHL